MDIGGIRKYFFDLQPMKWILEMQKFYDENGRYRVEDLSRLLGDSMRGVSFSNEGMEDSLLKRFL